MAEDRLDELVHELAALGRGLEPDRSADSLAAAVMERVQTLPPPGAPQPLPARLRGRVRDLVEGAVPRRRIALVVGALLLALLAAPPVRAAIADWFGFAGVIVEQDPAERGPASPPPPVAEDRSLTEAAAEAGFPVWVPVALGVPDGVTVTDDPRLVSMSWSGGELGTVRLDQFDARLDFSVLKSAPGVSYAAVGDADALWFAEPHEVVLLERDGTRRRESARLAGQTLIWTDGVTTLRLEGDLDLARAIEVAQSAERVP